MGVSITSHFSPDAVQIEARQRASGTSPRRRNRFDGPVGCCERTTASLIKISSQAGGLALTVGQGRLDLAVRNQGSNRASVFLGNGSGEFGFAANFSACVGPVWVALGDFNNDMQPGLAVANASNNDESIFINQNKTQ